LSVPTKDGVRRDERSDFGEGASPNGLAADSKTTTLVVGQTESPSTKLLLEDAILLSEIIDDRVLLTANPTGERCHEDLPGLKDGGHPPIVARWWRI